MAFGYVQQAIFGALEANERARIDEYKSNLNAYKGNFDKPLKIEPGDLDTNVVVNRVKPIVDATVNFLFGDPPKFELPDSDDTAGNADSASSDDLSDAKLADQKQRAKEEAWLAECLRLNNWGAFLLDEGFNGAICGTAYYKLSGTFYPNPKDPAHPYPRFYVLDPATMRILYDNRDIDDILGYEWKYNTLDPQTKKPRIERQLVEKQERGDGTVYWTITDQYSTGNSWQTPNWITISEVDWDYPWAPIAHWKNLPCPNEVYGAADVSEILIDANDSLNFNLSNRAKIYMHHAHPFTWIIGYNGQVDELDTAVGHVMSLGGTPQTLAIGQLVPTVDGTAGAQIAREIYEAMLEETGTPSIVLGRSDDAANNPSGVALKTKMWPMVAKTEVKRKLYGPALQELIRRLYELGNWGEDYIIHMTWPPIVPVDLNAEAQALQFMNAFGASPPTLLAMSGLDPKQERDNWLEWMQMIQKVGKLVANPLAAALNNDQNGQGNTKSGTMGAGSDTGATPKGIQEPKNG